MIQICVGILGGNDVEEFERRVNMFKIPCSKFLKINKMKKYPISIPLIILYEIPA